MSAALAQKQSVAGLPTLRSRALAVRPVARAGPGNTAGKGRTDVTKIGVNAVEEKAVRQNLKGRSDYMSKKEWRDANGRKGTGKGVYQFEGKYGANVDGYSPIYTPDIWAPSGNTYSLGTKGLIAWAGLVLVLLLVGVNLVVSTSQLGQ